LARFFGSFPILHLLFASGPFPLRKQREDIVPLAEWFMEQFAMALRQRPATCWLLPN
jgi:transcriptional regulator of aromatic amino acid metabolism